MPHGTLSATRLGATSGPPLTDPFLLLTPYYDTAFRLKTWPTFLVTALLLLLFASHGALGDEHLLVLVDPAAPLEEAWTHRKFGAATEYRRVEVDGTPYIRAVGRNSASGLYGEVNFHPVAYPWLEWTWRVDKLQKTADIRTKAGEDMAAAIYLLFGRPSWFRPEVAPGRVAESVPWGINRYPAAG